MNRRTRRFSLADLMILIAAIAAAMVSVRSLWVGHANGPGVISAWQAAYNRFFVASLLSACVTPLSLACVAFRLRRPRPPWRRVALQPGIAAMIACVVIFTARTMEIGASLISPDVFRPFGTIEYGRASPIRYSESSYMVLMSSTNKDGVIGTIEPFVCHSTLVASLAWPCGSTVAAVWLLLVVSGRWRPEKSWIDRMGRLIGATWILISLLAAYPVR